MVGEELKGDYFEDGEEELVAGGDVDDVFYKPCNVRVPFNSDRDDAAGTGGDFLDVREGLFVLQDR